MFNKKSCRVGETHQNSLPIGWINCQIGKYLFLKNGFAFKSKDYIDKGENTVPVIRISDIDGRQASSVSAVHVFKDKKVSDFKIKNGDLLIAMSGATTGKIGVFNGKDPAYQNQRVGNILLCSKKYGSNRFRNYLISSLTKEILDIAYGGAQPNISGKAIESIEVTLPPLAEQKEIATQLDNLLAQVDTLKNRLDTIPKLLKQFRQSVLAAAVSGRLTEDWREPHVRLLVWIKKTIGSISIVATGKTPKRSVDKYWNNGDIPWLTSSVTGREYCIRADQYVTQFAVDDCSLKLFPEGTLLLAMYGEGKTRGQVTELMLSATCNQACAAITVNESLAKHSFVKLRLQENYDETRKAASGGNQPNLNLKKVRDIPINLPPIEEQTEIIVRVETLFAFADKIEKRLKKAQEQANNLTPSLLAKAFRGDLTAEWRKQNPDLITGKNSAEALLARIKAEQEKLKPKRNTRKKKR